MRVEQATRPVQVEGRYLDSPGLFRFPNPFADAVAVPGVRVYTEGGGHRGFEDFVAVATMLLDELWELLGGRVAGHIGQFDEFPGSAFVLGGCEVRGHTGPFG